MADLVLAFLASYVGHHVVIVEEWVNCVYISTTQDGYTPLVDAALCNKCDVLIELLDYGADINAQTNVSYKYCG